MKNYFETFALDQQYPIDLNALNTAYLKAQAEVHPDKFAQASDQEKRLSLQLSTYINEAFLTLKHPLKRAAYLCELKGWALQTHSNTTMPPAFLMQQIEWREILEDAKAEKQREPIYQLETDVHNAYQQELQHLAQFLEQAQYEAAMASIRVGLFLEKFLADISHVLDSLE